MPIDNPQVVRFCNEKARPMADALLSAYRTAQAVVDFYYSDPKLGDALVAGIADTVTDGSDKDGRQILTGNDVLAIVTRAEEIVRWLDGKCDMTPAKAESKAELNTVLAVAVRGTSWIS